MKNDLYSRGYGKTDLRVYRILKEMGLSDEEIEEAERMCEIMCGGVEEDEN